MKTANHHLEALSPDAQVPGATMREGAVAPRFCSGSMASLALAVALAACGGGGPDGVTRSTPAGTPPPEQSPATSPTPPQTTLSGQVAQVATPVTVTLTLIDPQQPDQTLTLQATADANGHFTLSAPTQTIPRSSQIAAVVTADGYLPTTIVYATGAAAELTTVSVTNALGTLPTTGQILLTATTTEVFSVPGLETLKRLGDGNAPGPANSQLQLPAPPATQPMIMATSQPMNYGNSAKTTLSVSLLARGLEVSSCPGSSLRLRSFDAAGAELPAQAMALVQTPSNGDFLSMSFAFSLDPVALIGGAYQLEVSTAYCGSNDYDDMEFVGVTASLN